jgi:Tfp pilus assembly protein PilF
LGLFRRVWLGNAVALATCLAVLAGCVSKSTSAARSPEQQSEGEFYLASDLFSKGDLRPALDHGRRAVELDDDNAKAHYQVASIYLAFCYRDLHSPDCRLDEAEKSARKALAIEEKFRDARNMLGAVLILQKKYLEATKVLEPLVQDPAYTESHLAWGNYGWAQVLAGSLDQGIASLRNSVTNPRFCVGFYRLGLAYEKKGIDFLPLAEANLTRAVSVESPDCLAMQDAWEARGRVRARLGRKAEAREDYVKCRDLAADSPTGKACVQALVADSTSSRTRHPQ